MTNLLTSLFFLYAIFCAAVAGAACNDIFANLDANPRSQVDVESALRQLVQMQAQLASTTNSGLKRRLQDDLKERTTGLVRIAGGWENFVAKMREAHQRLYSSEPVKTPDTRLNREVDENIFRRFNVPTRNIGIGTPKDRFLTYAFSPDAKYVAVGEKEIGIWEIGPGTLRLANTLTGHKSGVHSLDYSPDGRYLVSGSADKTVIVWDLLKNKKSYFREHKSPVWDARFSPDGRYVVSGDDKGRVYVWEAATKEVIHKLPSQRDPVLSVRYSPDGKYIATRVTHATKVVLWDAVTGNMVRELKRSREEYCGIEFSPDSQFLLTTLYYSPVVLIWSLKKGKVVGKLSAKEKEGHVLDATYSPDGKYVLGSMMKPSQAIIWDVQSGDIIHTLEGHTKEVRDARFAPVGNALATFSIEQQVILWDWTGDDP